MIDRPNIIAVGLRTRKDLDLLGSGFRAAIPIQNVPVFEDLLLAIDLATSRAPHGYR